MKNIRTKLLLSLFLLVSILDNSYASDIDKNEVNLKDIEDEINMLNLNIEAEQLSNSVAENKECFINAAKKLRENFKISKKINLSFFDLADVDGSLLVVEDGFEISYGNGSEKLTEPFVNYSPDKKTIHLSVYRYQDKCIYASSKQLRGKPQPIPLMAGEVLL